MMSTAGASGAGGGMGIGGGAGTGGAKSADGGAGTGGSLMPGADAGPFVAPTCTKGNSTLPAGAPTLVPGTWKNISPPGVPFDANATAFTQGMTIDPCNPATIYVGVFVQNGGLYRSIDAGATWTELGAFDRPVNIRVDPNDPQHLYVGDGVGGSTNGFWVSHDGGQTWAMPDGFKAAAKIVSDYDVYHVEPDPADFNHVLVSFHFYWQNGTWTGALSGVFESFDGGDHFIIHQPNQGWEGAGGYNVFFLYNPALNIGNNKTWLYGTQGKGYWRTTDAGTTWTKVSDVSMDHGGGQLYYTKSGVLYASGSPSILRSADNGATWTKIGPYNAFLSVIGDGTHLYTGGHGGGHFLTAKESDDATWTDFNSQTFFEGPFEMALDSSNGILYSGNIRHGMWALKIAP